jgi:hypothetical protein
LEAASARHAAKIDVKRQLKGPLSYAYDLGKRSMNGTVKRKASATRSSATRSLRATFTRSGDISGRASGCAMKSDE